MPTLALIAQAILLSEYRQTNTETDTDDHTHTLATTSMGNDMNMISNYSLSSMKKILLWCLFHDRFS